MSRSSERRVATALAVAAVLVAGFADSVLAASDTDERTAVPLRVAGVEPADGRERDTRGRGPIAQAPQAEPAPTKPRLDEAPAPRARKGPLLRCFQYGRLIYEGPGGPVTVDKGQPTPRIGVGPSVQLYDLKSATCILEQAGG